MNYPVDKKIPKALFVQLLMDKGNMLKKHLKDTKSNLRIVANIGPNMATIKLYNIREEDSQELCVTIYSFRGQRQTIVSAMGAAELSFEGVLSSPVI